MSAGRVAIRTGRADGTTLLDGEVTVNGGLAQRYASREHQDAQAGQSNDDNVSVCRIRVNDAIQPAGDNTNELYFLRGQLARAHTKIEQLETRQRELHSKLGNQSSQMTALGIRSSRYEGQLNLDETNRVNHLIRRYEQLFTQSKPHFFI